MTMQFLPPPDEKNPDETNRHAELGPPSRGGEPPDKVNPDETNSHAEAGPHSAGGEPPDTEDTDETNSHAESTSQSPGGEQCNGERAKLPIFDTEQCLAALTRLVGLLTMDMITTQKANSIRGTISDILRHHSRIQGAGSPPVLDSDDLRTKIRQDPGLLNLFAPFLTQAQIDELMGDIGGNGD